jgi:hypothetical protein
VKLTVDLHEVLRLRMNGAVPLLSSHTPLWRSQEQFFLLPGVAVNVQVYVLA